MQYLTNNHVCCVKLHTTSGSLFVFCQTDKLQVQDKEVFLSFFLSKPVVQVKELKANHVINDNYAQNDG